MPFLENAITKRNYLKSFSVDFIPTLQPILDAMDSNDVQLDHFAFKIDPINNSITGETFGTIKLARSVSSISSLEVSTAGRCLVDPLRVSPHLISFCLNLNNLTSLDIACFSYSSAILLIDILQNLTMLQNLKFKSTFFLENWTHYDKFYSKISTIHTGRLESMNLYSLEPVPSWNISKLNDLLAFVLQSSPKLKIFKFSGEISDSTHGVIKLDFREKPLYTMRPYRFQLPIFYI